MTTQRGTVNKFLSTSALTLGLIASASATANAMDANTTPTGEQVVAGSANFDRPDASTLNINQNTDRVVINWDSFNIGSNAKTEFFQPNSGSLAVNRVTSRNSDPTQILGTLKANGRVMVLDRNGVVFGAGSRVDVGGIVASTGDVNDDAVMRGDTKLELSNFGDASVINNGTISVTGAGLAALVAPHVANNGVIEARLGKVVLASGGERATVDLYGDGLVEIAVGGAKGKALVENSGVISGATVLMTASGAKEVVDTVINMSGVVQATSATVQGGKIILNGGDAGKVVVSGVMDASGAAGGGDIKVTGESVVLTDASVVRADATGTGNGGRIGIWGNDYAIMGGRASARGGKFGGNGGFVGLSAANNVGFDGLVDTTAEKGETGTFLIDPKTIKLGNYNFLDAISGAFVNHWAVDAQALANTLRSSNVHLWATDRIYTTSDFDISTWQGLFFSGTTTKDLTLSANTIDILHNITLGTGSLILRDALTTDSIFGFALVRPSSDINLATVNLNAQILKKSGGLADSNQIEGFADVVNVLSPNAYISQGVEFARAGGTVDVKPGLYNQGDIQINKALTVLGAGAGQTIVNAQGYGAGFMVYSGDVTIDGFDIRRGALSGMGAGTGIWVFGKGHTNVANTIGNITIGDNGTGRGGNTIDGGFRYGVLIQNGNVYGVDIVGNNLRGMYSAIEVNGSSNGGKHSNINIAENDISNVAMGLTLQDLTGSNTVSNNIFSDVDSYNIDTGAGHTGDNLRVYNNSFDANAQRLINNSGVGTVNASGNWWGTNNEATIASKMFGFVDFTPFLMGGADTSVARGFQGDFSNLFVTKLGAQTGTVGRIQEGVDNVLTAGTVTVGNGTFDENVAIYKSMTLQSLNGANKTTISGVPGLGADAVVDITADDVTLGGGGQGFDVEGNGVNYGVRATNANNVKLTQNNVSGTASDGIRIIGGADATVQSGRVDNVGGDGVHVENNASVSVSKVKIFKTGGDGIDVRGSAGATITKNFIGQKQNGDPQGAGNVQGDGIYVEASNGAFITDNKIMETGSTAFDVGSGIHSKNNNDVTISGNTLDQIDWDGVKISGGNNVVVDANIVSNVTRVAVYGGGFNGLAVSNNVINNAGAGLTGYGAISTDGGANLTIAENAIDGNVGSGIKISGAGGVNLIDNNVINNVGEHGVEGESVSALTVSNNRIGTLGGVANVKGYGVHLSSSSGANVTGNLVENVAGRGIDVNKGSNVTLKNNTLDRIGQEGIRTERVQTLTLIGNTLDHVGWNGVDIQGGSNVTVKKTTLKKAGGRGINVAGAQGFVTVSGNDVYNIGESGIVVDGTKNTTISNNVVHAVGTKVNASLYNGIDVNNVQGGLFVTNNHVGFADRFGTAGTMGNIEGTGIVVKKSGDARINNNNVTRANGGILLTDAAGANIIRKNSISDVATYGIYAVGSSNVTIGGANSAHQNDVNDAESAIIVENSTGTTLVQNNWAHDVDYGVRLFGTANAGIIGNHLGGNSIIGIDVAAGSHGANISGNELHHFDTGILVSDSDNVDVVGNLMYDLGDGIVLNNADFALIARNAVGLFAGNGISALNGSDNAEIRRNAVGLGLGDGVVVADSADASIHHNLIGALAGNGVTLDDANRAVVDRNLILLTARNGILVRGGADSTITNNIIGLAGRDGVRVNNANGLTTIHDNLIGLVADDGIDVNGSDNVDIRRNQIEFVGGNGVELNHNGRVRVVNNDIGQWGFVGNNGIEADGNRRVRIARNDISNAANNGIMIDENNRVRIVSNLITNSGNAGLYAAGADNGVVILEDNVFTDNPIGAWFESGIIDLTGATNTFNGGDIGMRFAPVGNPNDLTLVGNTIGTTTFNGQSQYYIELANAAFFAPGLPTILNGLDASYDGFVPNSVGGILTQAQFDAIESKIYHFNDDGSLGLFFFGAVPGIDDEDVYNRFGDLNWAGGRFRMTILGLPSVPGAGANRVGANSPAGQPGFTGNVAEFLANLAPAAGGDDQQDGQQQRGQSISIAGQLADLEPAAGGEGGEVSCWSDAMSQAAGGGAVNYSFGGSMEESLSQAASCGGAI